MNCKVIATSFRGGRDNRNHIEQPNLEFPDHYQNLRDPEEHLTKIQNVVAFEMKQNPGVEMDLIIINNDAGFREGNIYIASLDGASTPYGKIITRERPNAGWSFGAFNYAFKEFRDKYEYWLFTEDDILVGGEDYYKKAKDKFDSIKDIGFLALVKAVNSPYGLCAGGGVGLTKRSILDEVVAWKGRLAHYQKEDDHSNDFRHQRHLVITSGEVEFTNEIWQLGYSIEDYGNGKEWSLEKNLCIPYYNYIYEIH